MPDAGEVHLVIVELKHNMGWAIVHFDHWPEGIQDTVDAAKSQGGIHTWTSPNREEYRVTAQTVPANMLLNPELQLPAKPNQLGTEAGQAIREMRELKELHDKATYKIQVWDVSNQDKLGPRWRDVPEPWPTPLDDAIIRGKMSGVNENVAIGGKIYRRVKIGTPETAWSGDSPPGAVISPALKEKIRKEWEQAHKGAFNAGHTVLIHDIFRDQCALAALPAILTWDAVKEFREDFKLAEWAARLAYLVADAMGRERSEKPPENVQPEQSDEYVVQFFTMHTGRWETIPGSEHGTVPKQVIDQLNDKVSGQIIVGQTVFRIEKKAGK